MTLSSTRTVVILGLFLVAAACSSTKLVNHWQNPQYVPARFDRVMVIGVSQQAGLRRSLEDEFVARLAAEGVNAVPSYHFIPEEGQMPEARLRAAVREANADGILMTRLVRVERRTEVTPGSYTPVIDLYPWYSAAWFEHYEPPRVYQYDVFFSETTLYDVRQNQLVWSGTVQTTQPGNLNKEIKKYVTTVVRALKNENILVVAAR